MQSLGRQLGLGTACNWPTQRQYRVGRLGGPRRAVESTTTTGRSPKSGDGATQVQHIREGHFRARWTYAAHDPLESRGVLSRDAPRHVFGGSARLCARPTDFPMPEVVVVRTGRLASGPASIGQPTPRGYRTPLSEYVKTRCALRPHRRLDFVAHNAILVYARGRSQPKRALSLRWLTQ